MMTTLLRKLVVDVPALTENTVVPLRVCPSLLHEYKSPDCQCKLKSLKATNSILTNGGLQFVVVVNARHCQLQFNFYGQCTHLYFWGRIH